MLHAFLVLLHMLCYFILIISNIGNLISEDCHVNIMFVPTQHFTNGAIAWTTEAHTSCIGGYIVSVLFVSVLSTLIVCPFHIIGSLVLSHNVEGVFLKKQSLCESSKLRRHKCHHVILNRNNWLFRSQKQNAIKSKNKKNTSYITESIWTNVLYVSMTSKSSLYEIIFDIQMICLITFWHDFLKC
jgi:hypothetical protein